MQAGIMFYLIIKTQQVMQPLCWRCYPHFNDHQAARDTNLTWFCFRSSGLEERWQDSSTQLRGPADPPTGADPEASRRNFSQRRCLHSKQTSQPETRFEVSYSQSFGRVQMLNRIYNFWFSFSFVIFSIPKYLLVLILFLTRNIMTLWLIMLWLTFFNYLNIWQHIVEMSH